MIFIFKHTFNQLTDILFSKGKILLFYFYLNSILIIFHAGTDIVLQCNS